MSMAGDYRNEHGLKITKDEFDKLRKKHNVAADGTYSPKEERAIQESGRKSANDFVKHERERKMEKHMYDTIAKRQDAGMKEHEQPHWKKD